MNTMDLVPQVGDVVAAMATVFSRFTMNVKSATDATRNTTLGSPVMLRYDVPSGFATVLTDPSRPKTLMSLSRIKIRYLMVPSLSTTVVNGRPAPADPANSLARCCAGGRFFSPSTGLGMQLTICSH
jgi:hypothetical protein